MSNCKNDNRLLSSDFLYIYQKNHHTICIKKLIRNKPKSKRLREVETHYLVKEKFWAQRLVKKVTLTVFWDRICVNDYEPKSKRLDGVEKHWLSGKGKVLVAPISKKGYADSVFWDRKDLITIDFLEKRCNCRLFPIANFKGNISPYLLNDPRIFRLLYFLFFHDILAHVCQEMRIQSLPKSVMMNDKKKSDNRKGVVSVK